jgi:tetratricopeptide (TPR) repeat protein
MQRWSFLRNGLRMALILVALAGLILLPPVLTGLGERGRADQAMGADQFDAAAAAYRSAAERLPWQPSLWEQAGEAAFLAGDPGNAILYFKNAEALTGLSPWGWTYLGLSYQKQGDIPSAVAAWKRALPLAEAYGLLAQAERQAGDFSAAMDDWRASIARESENAAAHYQLGLLLAATAPGEALPELMKSAALNPYLDTYVQSLRTSLNTALLSDDPAYQLLVSGRGLGALGEWDLAAEAFRRTAALHPDYADAWAWLGEARQHLGQDGSVEIEKAVALAPQSAMVQSLYGIYWQRKAQPVQALVAYQRAAELEPANAAWLAAMGSAHEQGGDLIKALDDYNRAVQLAPNDASVWQVLAEFSLRNSVDPAGVGLPAARRLLELDKDDWRAVDLVGQLTLAVGDFAGAEPLLRQALAMAPRQATPALHLGLLYLTTGDGASARTFLEKAAALDPDGAEGQQADRLLEQYFPSSP